MVGFAGVSPSNVSFVLGVFDSVGNVGGVSGFALESRQGLRLDNTLGLAKLLWVPTVS